MRTVFITPLILALTTSQALALSCMQPSPAMSMSHALNQPGETWLVNIKPTEDFSDQDIAKEQKKWGRNQDQAQTRNKAPKTPSFTAPFDITPLFVVIEGNPYVEHLDQDDGVANVTLSQGCAGPWCSGFPTRLLEEGRAAIITRDSEEAPWKLALSPCPGQIFETVTQEDWTGLMDLFDVAIERQ